MPALLGMKKTAVLSRTPLTPGDDIDLQQALTAADTGTRTCPHIAWEDDEDEDEEALEDEDDLDLGDEDEDFFDDDEDDDEVDGDEEEVADDE